MVLPRMPSFSSTGDSIVFYQIAQRVVSNNEVALFCAASGVVAIFVNNLLAQRTRSFFIQHFHSQTISYGDSEVSRPEQRVFAIFI